MSRGGPVEPSAGGSDDRAGERRAVVGFGLVSFFSDLAHETVSGLLPAFLAAFGAPPIALGLVEGASDAAATFAKIAGGELADRLRRLKPWCVAGYLLTGLAVPAIAWTTSWGAVLALRSLAWVGRGFRSPLRDTLLVGAVAPERRGAAFGLERAMDQLGALAAPLLAIALIAAGLAQRTVIALAVVPGVLAALALAAFVREREHAPRAAGRERDAAGDGGAQRRFRRLLLALAVFGSGDFAKTLLVLWALGPGVAAGGVEAGHVTLGLALYAGFNLVTIGAAWLGGRLSDRVGRKRVLVTAYALGAAGALVPVLAAPTIGAAGLALALSGALVGTEEAVERAWAADLAPGGRSGRAFGLVHATNGVGDLVASALVGGLWTIYGAEVAFGSAAAVMGVGAWLASRA